MDTRTMERIYLYSRFERFWHWAQAALIVFLAVTGFEVHGTYRLFGFQKAAELHNTAGMGWFVLYVFIIFWKLTTGEWKNYVPTTRKLAAVVGYYAYGIFRGDAHPVPRSERNKHNPLQRLTYLGIAVVLIPVQVTTGLLYYLYNSWPRYGIQLSLSSVATVHMLGAFALVAFLVGHLYMITTGHSLTGHLKAMCTGWEEAPANGSQTPSVGGAA
ncbi:MAG: cytochrome b/b6 domain-containing protein [Syntrophobacteraceae bacterium]|jgi:thiosulfate reductase cytochrome b subunit|nr:cytochrome b/b6 domain-containing protein [Syntrophobacteraceae bacterium]MCU0586663.1 cytochrome b/b6 domain-containing protein [Syntrophobacteraceae bacterium]